MKKKYIVPAMEMVDAEVNSILCGSITEAGDNLNVIIGGSDVFGDDETIN